MPTYEYTCKLCNHRFEKFISSAEKSKVRCPVCGSSQLQEIYGFNTSKSSARDSSCDTCPSQRPGFT